jgi:hypothetical protein
LLALHARHDLVARLSTGAFPLVQLLPRPLLLLLILPGFATQRSVKDQTRCTFMTIGMLLQLLIHQKDTALNGVSHIIIDEAHEREVDMDLVLTVLKRRLMAHDPSSSGPPPFRLIIMSATFNAGIFADYFAHVPLRSRGAGQPSAAVEVRQPLNPNAEPFVPGEGEGAGAARPSDTANAALVNAAPLSTATDDEDEKETQAAASRGAVTVQKQPAPVKQVGAKCFPVHVYYSNQLQAALGEEGLPALRNSKLEEADASTPEGQAEMAAAIAKEKESGLKMDKKLYDAVVWILTHLRRIEQGHYEDMCVPESCHSGAVLVFAPGVPEIMDLLDKLVDGGVDDRKFLVIPLHGLLEDKRQEQIFAPCRDGRRKVIVGTNIAESSVTIPDISYVIDLGLEKMPCFDAANNTDELLLKRCSQASAGQRSGRAGRVAEGVCFRLYSEAAFARAMPRFAPPEILRTSLTNLVLKVKIIDPEDTAPEHEGLSMLAECIQPPAVTVVQQSLQKLCLLGALSRASGRVTTLGVVLSHLPHVDLSVGWLLLLGHAMGSLVPAATLAAGLALHQDIYMQPFVHPVQSEDKAMAKLRTDAAFAEADVSYFMPRLVRLVKHGCQSAPITNFHLFGKWSTTREEHGDAAARELLAAECAAPKRLRQQELSRDDLLRRLKQQGFSEELEDEDSDGEGIDMSATDSALGSHDVASKDAKEMALPGELLLKAILLGAFPSNIAVATPARPYPPPQLAMATSTDPARTVYFKCELSDEGQRTADATPQQPPPRVDFAQAPGMAALERALQQCCVPPEEEGWGGGQGIAIGGGLDAPKPRLSLARGGKGDQQYLVAEFPTAIDALLGVRLVGLRKRYPILGGRTTESGAVPMLTQPAFRPRLAFSRTAHKTEADLAEGTNRGHLVELHWQSSCALLHDADEPDAGTDGSSPRSEVVAGHLACSPTSGGARYLVSTGYLRPGYSRHRLLALHPTLLPSTPMVSELMLLVFAREVSWLVCEPPPQPVGEPLPAIKFAGAEVNRGDDATVLVFCRVLTDADIELINRIRKALSRAMGTQLGESGNGKILRRDLAILLVGRQRSVQQPPPKPWRKIVATELQDWDELWAPLLRAEEVVATVSRHHALVTQRATEQAAARARAAQETFMEEMM